MAAKKKKDVAIDLKDWLTTKDLCRILGVTIMMVYLYREGRCATITPLPYYVVEQGKRNRIWFKTRDVRAWIKKNGFVVEEAKFQELP